MNTILIAPRLRGHVIAFLPLFALFAVPALTPPVLAQKLPGASETLANIRREYEKINDYVADVNVVVNVPGMKMPPMDAKIYFKKPDKIHLDASGFAMLPRDVVGYNPSVFNEAAFDAVIQGEETVDGAPCVKLKLLAKSDTMRLQRVMLVVDRQRWLILRMTTDPLQGNTAEASITYALIDNKYHLPAGITMNLTMTGNMNMHGPRGKLEPNGSGEKKNATVRLAYKNYRVNKGIDDAVFAKKAKP
jgi:outer membrane lipoprotein-sorting protein